MDNYYTSTDYDESFEDETPFLDSDDSDSDDPTIDLGQLYQFLSNNSIAISKRLELFALLQNQLKIGNIALARIASYHTQFCIDLVSKFNTRTGVGELSTHEKLLLIPMLEFLQDVFLMGDKTFVAITLKSQLMANLVKLVSIYADRTEQMTKNVFRMCTVDTVLGHTEVVAPHDILRSVVDVPDIPEVFYTSNVCKVVEMQHRYDCECPDCKDTPDRPSAPANPFMLYSGKIGTNIYPVRHLQQHKAAICPFPEYWEFIASRSKKISGEIFNLAKESSVRDDRFEGQSSPPKFIAGQLVAFATESLSWMNYDPSAMTLIYTLPPLPPYMRGFVVGECSVALNNPQVGVWVPDFALCALCAPNKLTLLSEFSTVRTFTPLVYIAAAYPDTSMEVVSFAICFIYDMLLKNAKRDSVRQLLDDKGPWKMVQLLRFLDSGEARSKLLAIINILIHNEKDDRGCKGVFSSGLHNTLADWLVWKTFTQSMPELEKSEILEGLMLLIPRIEVRKWPRRTLVLQAIYALMKGDPSPTLENSLQKCKNMLAWNQMQSRYSPQNSRRDGMDGRQFQHHRQPYNNNYGRERPFQHRHSNAGQEHRGWQGNYADGDRNGRNKARAAEFLSICKNSTHNMVLAPPSEPGDRVDVLRATLKTMVRGLIYHDAKQGLSCELMQVTNLQDVRQPNLARYMCGMLNSGGGDIYIGLHEGLVQGVHAPRPERDSFTQGVIDVAEYCLEPRLPPYAFHVERRVVLKSEDHVPYGEWNRFVFVIHLIPQKNVVYQIVPEKQSFIRRPPEGTTVLLTQEVCAGDGSEILQEF